MHHELFQKQRNLGHDGSETDVRVGNPDPTAPRLGDRHESSCECDEKNGADILEHGNRDGNPRSLEAVVNQREYFQNPVVVLGPWEQRAISRGFRCYQAGKMQAVTLVVRDRNQTNQRKEGEAHLSQRYRLGIAADVFMEITMCLLGAVADTNVWTNAQKKKPYEVLEGTYHRKVGYQEDSHQPPPPQNERERDQRKIESDAQPASDSNSVVFSLEPFANARHTLHWHVCQVLFVGRLFGFFCITVQP